MHTIQSTFDTAYADHVYCSNRQSWGLGALCTMSMKRHVSNISVEKVIKPCFSEQLRLWKGVCFRLNQLLLWPTTLAHRSMCEKVV